MERVPGVERQIIVNDEVAAIGSAEGVRCTAVPSRQVGLNETKHRMRFSHCTQHLVFHTSRSRVPVCCIHTLPCMSCLVIMIMKIILIIILTMITVIMLAITIIILVSKIIMNSECKRNHDI
jgi:hypothetical protein